MQTTVPKLNHTESQEPIYSLNIIQVFTLFYSIFSLLYVVNYSPDAERIILTLTTCTKKGAPNQCKEAVCS